MADTSYSLSLLEGNVPRYASIDLQSGKAYTALFGLDVTAEGGLTGYGIGLSSGQSVASGTQYVIQYNDLSSRFYLAAISSDENPGIQGPGDATAGYYVYGYTTGGSAGWTVLPTGIPYLTDAKTMKSLRASSDGNYVLSWNSASSTFALTDTSDAATITGLGTGGSAQNCLLAKQENTWTAIPYPSSNGTYNLSYSGGVLSLASTQSALPTVSHNLVYRERIREGGQEETPEEQLPYMAWGCASLTNTGSTGVGCFSMSNEKQIQKGDYLVTLDIGYYLENVSYKEAQVTTNESGSTMCALVDDQFEGESSNTYMFDIEIRFTPNSIESIGAEGSNYYDAVESVQNTNFYNVDSFWRDTPGVKTVVGTSITVPSGTPSLRYVTTSFYIDSENFVGDSNANYYTIRLVLRNSNSSITGLQSLCLSRSSTITFTPI